VVIYLLPISHDVQLGHDVSSGQYEIYLKESIKSLKINLICEELSEDDVKASVHTCIALNLSKELGVDYEFCNPRDKERKKIGMLSPEEIMEKMDKLHGKAKTKNTKSNKTSLLKFKKEMTADHNKREAYWLKKININKEKKIIFIFGVGHLSSHRSVLGDGFDKLLESEGHKIYILSMNFINPKFL
jgi:hypothetical protein